MVNLFCLPFHGFSWKDLNITIFSAACIFILAKTQIMTSNIVIQNGLDGPFNGHKYCYYRSHCIDFRLYHGMKRPTFSLLALCTLSKCHIYWIVVGRNTKNIILWPCLGVMLFMSSWLTGDMQQTSLITISIEIYDIFIYRNE